MGGQPPRRHEGFDVMDGTRFSKQGCPQRGAEAKPSTGHQKGQKGTNPKKMNSLRKLPWRWAGGSEGGNCGGVQGAGVPVPAALVALWRSLPRTAALAAGWKLAGHGQHVSCSPFDEKRGTFVEEEECDYCRESGNDCFLLKGDVS